MKIKHLRPLPLLLLLCFLLVLTIGIYVIVVTNQVRTNFTRSPEADGWDVSYSRMLKKINATDFNLKIPGLDGEITFTAPYAISYEQFGIKHVIPRGEPITSDFVSVSIPGMGKVKRTVALTVKGHRQEITLEATALSRLYRIALRQNHLTSAFEADFGAPLTRLNSRNALRVIDRQLYEKGLLCPRDYPYDQNALMSLLIFGIFGLPIILIFSATLLSMAIDNLKYRRFLKAYNREHSEDWDSISGTLPQFHSLRASGISMDALPPRQKKRFLDTLKNQFRPVR